MRTDPRFRLRPILAVLPLILSAIALFQPLKLSAQVIIYSDNFNNGCASNCLASTYPGWTIVNNVGGTTGGSPNDWFISCAEDGIAPPGCGSTCAGDASLHIGADAGGGGDMGATFNETGAINATFKRVQSPTINLTGFNTNTLAFDFIAFGSASCSDDRAQLWLSTDNGATWPVGFQYCLTSVCCGACNGYSQGQWTTYTLALPAAFNNNPNVRVGYHWRNNGNGSGTDPSVAIDDLRITTVVTPVTLQAFHAKESDGAVKLDWMVTRETMLKQYEVERSLEPKDFRKIGTVAAKGGSLSSLTYSFRDTEAEGQTQYYRLKMLDLDGQFTYSNVIRVVSGSKAALDLGITATAGQDLTATFWAASPMTVDIKVYDLQSKLLKHIPDYNLIGGENHWRADFSGMASAAYLLQVKTVKTPPGLDPVTITRKFVF